MDENCPKMVKVFIVLVLSFIGIAFSEECNDQQGERFCKYYKKDCATNLSVRNACQRTCQLCGYDCDVAIVGGGLSGLYTAESLLRHGKETKVCVFERDVRLGGRIYDYVFPEVQNVTVGLGAWRIDMVHHNMRGILSRLNIPHADWNFYSDPKTESRGNVAREEQEIKGKSFPTLIRSKFRDMSCSQMLDYLCKEEHMSQIKNFATFETFQRHFLTPEGSRYYFDIFGYDGDLKGSPEGVLEFYSQLSELTGKEIRPLKGMSAFIDALAKSARDLGAKIFAGDDFKILSIDKTRNRFVLTTPKHEVRSSKLVIAAPPGSFKDVRGTVAERIQSEKAFQSILARPAFKGAVVYPCAWWEENKETVHLYPMERFLSNSDCLGWTVPHDGRGPEGQAVLHVSYNDGECGEKWGDILKLPKAIVDQEIHRALEYKFKRKIPKPLSTVYHYWNEGAWYLQKPGSNISMKQVTDWAKRPFPDEPIFVVGSAYHPYRGYSEGAIVSANNALNEGWQIPIASPLQARTHEPRRFADVDWRNIR